MRYNWGINVVVSRNGMAVDIMSEYFPIRVTGRPGE